MYFIQYRYEIIGDYSVEEETDTLLLHEIDEDMDSIKRSIGEKTNRNILSITEIQPLNEKN